MPLCNLLHGFDLKTSYYPKNKNILANLYGKHVKIESLVQFDTCGSISSISEEVLGLAHAVCELAWVNLIK